MRTDQKTNPSVQSPEPYCAAATNFSAYLKQAPAVSAKPLSGARVGGLGRVRATLSKISNVTMTVRRKGKIVSSRTIRLGYGTHTITWGPIAHSGPVSITVAASDLAGNAAAAAPLTQSVAKRRK